MTKSTQSSSTLDRKPQAPISSFLEEAVNQQAFLKMGMLGMAGSGKTWTAWLLAKGLSNLLGGKGEKPPVVFADTENGSDWLVGDAKASGIRLLRKKSRAFTDLMETCREAERLGAILQIDSITHYWTELQDAMKKAKNRTRLQFQDWDPLKKQWGEFTTFFLNSPVHILMLGRAGYEYEHTTNEDGGKEINKVGTKMKTESELGYEPSLLIEMIREPKLNEGEGTAGYSGPKTAVAARLWSHTAVVLKDRSRTMEGVRIVDPTYESFLPAIQALNLGGEHKGVDVSITSERLFDAKGGPEREAANRIRDLNVILEEIKELIVVTVPGSTAAEKAAKPTLLMDAFGTRSWTAVESMRLEDLVAGYEKLQGLCTAYTLKAKADAEAAALAKTKKAGKEE